jgi:peptidyl-Asp metalloendopeptidase
MNTDLSRLRSTSDGFMDELHALRNNYGADVVSLIENAPQYCGLAYRMATLSASFASSAFSIVHHSCATGYYSFAHEIGHNQGAHHDAANASGAIFPYAYGYQDPFGQFRSIMAYDCPGGCPRIALFSSGDNPLYGVPTGDANVASNATAIDQTAATVAAFRQLGASPPAAPADLYGSEISSSSLRLNWTDRSSDESGFVLERSFDGVSFTQIASLPANTNSYVDTNLQATTLYNYRARAWNSTAYSGYSNVLVAVTEAVSNLPTSPAPTAKFELKVNGYKVKGLQKADLSWSGSLSQTVDIYRDGSKLRSAVANTGKYLDNINRKASATYTYKVCEAGNATCSNSAVVSF